MTVKKISTKQAKAEVVHTHNTPFNETLTWRINHKKQGQWQIQSSRIWNPAETLIFPEGSSLEIAGGPGESHESAVRKYLESLDN